MKKFLLFLPFILLFSACNDSKNDNENTDGDNSGTYYVISGKVENTADVDIDSVYAVCNYLSPDMDMETYIFASSAFIDASFSLALPEELDKELLRNAKENLLRNTDGNAVQINNLDAYASSGLGIYAYRQGEFIGYLNYTHEDCMEECKTAYYYADRPFTIKGTNNDVDYYVSEYDVNFQQGWNLLNVYNTYTTSPFMAYFKMTNNTRTGLKWYFLPASEDK